MTAEIAIINQSAVALAADSAVTIGRDRVWKTTNKLFSLSPLNDIGIMIYGAADFISYPWETIIKLFRGAQTEQFETVQACKDSFIEFLKSERLSDSLMQEISASHLILTILGELAEGLETRSAIAFRSELKDRVEAAKATFEKHGIIADIDRVWFKERYQERILDFSKDEFKRHITKDLLALLTDLLFEAFRREEVESGAESGLVFAGFGRSELFPVVIHSIVDGKDGGHLRHWKMPNSCDFNETRGLRGTIIPFAQNDMTRLFLEGIFSQHLRWIGAAVEGLLNGKTEDIINKYVPTGERIVERKIQEDDNEKMVDRPQENFLEYRQETFVDPVMTVVFNLPKEDMAQMAEALVELTSLRRKVGSKIQSVSGPVDVAIISKGDGFIWIKRKHYFDIDFNKDYIYRKYGKAAENQNEH